MLYKKVHRQYLRECKIGRKFRFRGEVYKVTGKPFIYYSEGSICVKCSGPGNWDYWDLVVVNDFYGWSIGKRLDKDNIEWLN